MHLGLSVFAPGEECEGNASGPVCLYGCLTQKLSGSGYGRNNVFKDSSQLRDRIKYAIEVCHDVKRAL